jgi:trimethylamine--corrinoid protein Co-methyltransferase
MAALAGANLIYGAGMIESGVTFDCAQLVMDDEWAAMIKQVVGGVPIDPERLLLGDIAAVGPFGDFLSLDSTLRHMREQSQPRLMDRSAREDWQAGGASDLYERARLRALELLESHRPEPLDAVVAARMRRIVDEADRQAAG